MLLNFFSIDSGTIKIDSENIKNKNIDALRSLFGLVSQDVFLFNDSISNNISFGNPNINPNKIIEAAKQADAHRFISKLDNGYETIIKNQGKNLSSGQKQRISIARAIFGNYPILIFDEATSSLDSKSSRNIQNIINNIDKEKTCIIITHKLRSIQKLDRIFVMKDGKIIQNGTHKLLMNSSDVYQQLYNLDKPDDKKN